MTGHYLRRVQIAIASLFAPKGLVGPHIPATEWDKQFSGDKWEYLAKENQRGHYDCIIQLYGKFGKEGTILDIGCGEGLMYKYLAENPPFPYSRFLGVDISAVAVKNASAAFPGARFEAVNYEHEHILEKFDVIIFNETLYYFNNPLKTLEKCVAENLQPGGKIIISMCDHERHDLIWQHIQKEYHMLEGMTVANEEKISWTIRIFEPGK